MTRRLASKLATDGGTTTCSAALLITFVSILSLGAVGAVGSNTEASLSSVACSLDKECGAVRSLALSDNGSTQGQSYDTAANDGGTRGSSSPRTPSQGPDASIGGTQGADSVDAPHLPFSPG